MSHRIIYPNEQGGVVVIAPSPECLTAHTLEEIARKDVPAGLPYRIVETTALPSDWTFFAAWEADFSQPDGVGDVVNMFLTDPQHPQYVKEHEA